MLLLKEDCSIRLEWRRTLLKICDSVLFILMESLKLELSDRYLNAFNGKCMNICGR